MHLFLHDFLHNCIIRSPHLLQDQAVVDRIDGANAPELTRKVKQHACGTSESVSTNCASPSQSVSVGTDVKNQYILQWLTHDYLLGSCF